MTDWCWSRLAPWKGHEFGSFGVCRNGICPATGPVAEHILRKFRAGLVPQETPPKQPPAAESREKPFVGWRAWKLEVDDHGPVLVSTYKGTRWTGPVLHAHEPPPFNKPEGGVAYGPGIYVMKEWQDLTYPFIGTVELWGRVVEHEKGYRAEHALVTGLYHMPVESYEGTWDLMSALGSAVRQTRDGYRLHPDAPEPRPEIIKALAERYQCTVDTERFRRVAELREACKEPYEWTSESPNESGKSSRIASSLHVPTEKERRRLMTEFRPSLLRQSLSGR